MIDNLTTSARLNYTQTFRLYRTEHSPRFLETQTSWHCLEKQSAVHTS